MKLKHFVKKSKKYFDELKIMVIIMMKIMMVILMMMTATLPPTKLMIVPTYIYITLAFSY